MNGRVRQIDRHEKNLGLRRWLKRQASRARRRFPLDEIPTARYRNYSG